MRNEEPLIDPDSDDPDWEQRIIEKYLRREQLWPQRRAEFEAEIDRWCRDGDMSSAQWRVVDALETTVTVLVQYAVATGRGTQDTVRGHVMDVLVWFGTIADEKDARDLEEASGGGDAGHRDVSCGSGSGSDDDDDDGMALYVKCFESAMETLVPILPRDVERDAVVKTLHNIFDVL